ncbi:methylenetetrahydrofolate reductase [Corynebacterium sp. A21]|uniref:methylenetetrahydrofolate reductase n=1 Tax=Corynebacterium sp. A21 TaxID=3457318 RepID=UPI003FD5149C
MLGEEKISFTRTTRVSASAPLDDELFTLSEDSGHHIPALDPTDLLGREPGARHRTSLSFEVMPPRDGADQAKIDTLLTTLESYNPDYLAVTSSQRSSWLAGTANFISQIDQTTRMRPLAHLTCTAGPTQELVGWINNLVDAGVRGFLALRGDYPAGQTGPDPGHLGYANELVRLIRDVEKRQAARFGAGRLAVGVAAYPSGHAESHSHDEDIDVLLAKQRCGADFAITQLFFEAEDFIRFRERARLAGVSIPLIPGIVPITSVQRLRRMSGLSGLNVPQRLMSRLAAADTPEGEYEIGMQATADLARTLLSADTESLHLYTFNRPDITVELLDRIGIAPRAKRR